MKEEKKSTKIDMLNGSISDKILKFALPLAASSILQQLFNSSDIAVVGRFAGSEALAAVGGNSAVISLLINLFVGLSVGANVVIANYIGQKREDKIHDAVHTVMTMALISGILLLFLGGVIAKPILKIMDTPDEVLNLASTYLKLYFCGMPFVMVYNFGSAILRSIGDTKRPLYCLIVSGIINVLLNLLLVIVFKLSVVGVAIATIISNAISSSLIVYLLTHTDDIIKLEIKKLTLKKEQVLSVIKIGAPAGLQGMVFSVSNVCIQTSINSFGTSAIAGSAAALNYEYFTYFVTNAFAQATVTFTSQNFGAGKFDRCKKIFRTCLIQGIIFTAIMSVIFVSGRSFFASIYTTDPDALKFATTRLIHAELLACLPCIYEISGGALRGIGHSMLPAILTVFGSCVLRLVWIVTIFKWFPSFDMLINVYPFSWIVTGIMVTVAYYIIRKKVFSKNIKI